MPTKKEFEDVLRELQKIADKDAVLGDSFLVEKILDEKINESEDEMSIKIPYVNTNPISGVEWV